jgi:hypothetical protein
MTPQEFADAVLQLWCDRREYIERLQKLGYERGSAIAIADETFCENAMELADRYERAIPLDAPPEEH